MRTITKSLLTLALLVLAVGSSKADNLVSDFSEIAQCGTNATWDAESKTMTWSATSYNFLSYFMINGVDKEGDYYNLSTWGTITITFTLTGESNEVRVRMKDSASGDGDWIVMTGSGTHTINISDFKKSGSALDYTKVVGIQLSGGSDKTGSATFSELYLEPATDPLATPRNLLNKAINEGKRYNSFAKTTASWNALQTEISNGETEYANASATAESLAAAKKAIEDAIAGLKLEDGYVNLTNEMCNNPAACTYTLFESVGLPYGTSQVDMNIYAELNEYDQFIVLASAGKPRFCMNRITSDGQIGADLASSNMIDINPNSSNTWATEKYQTIDGNKYTLDIKAIATDWNGLARLNCIKGANYGNVTVTDMLLYRTLTVGAAGIASFGSLSKSAKLNGTKAYAAKYDGSKIVLTEVTNIPTGKGVIVEATAGEYVPTFDVAADDIDTDLKVSNGTVTGDGSSIYVLANGGSGKGFYKLANGEKVPAGKAYLEITAGAPEFIGISGEATGINTVNVQKADNAIYNLGGQRVANAQKGIFIVNGKKVIK